MGHKKRKRKEDLCNTLNTMEEFKIWIRRIYSHTFPTTNQDPAK
jgi:hypothetical protein